MPLNASAAWWGADLEAAGGGNVPDAQGAVKGRGQQPARVLAHAQVADAIRVTPELAHAPHRLYVIPVQLSSHMVASPQVRSPVLHLAILPNRELSACLPP